MRDGHAGATRRVELEVLGWGPAGRRFWWLCPLPGPFGVPLHPVHERIAGVWGGIRGHTWQKELPVRPIWNWRSNEEVLSDRCAREPTAATIREWNEQWLEDTGGAFWVGLRALLWGDEGRVRR